MAYNVIFQEVAANGNGFAPHGKPEYMGTFPTEAQALRFVKENVNTYDLETLGVAHVANQCEPLALYQDEDLIGFYRIAA